MHKFSIRGQSYLVDEETLVCLSPDEVATRGIALWEESGRTIGTDELAGLLAEEYGYPWADEFMDEFSELSDILSQTLPRQDPPRSLRGIELHVAHSCNLACRYCFAAHGDYGAEHGFMSEDVAFRAVDMLVNNAHEQEDLTIVFFGGEPLTNSSLIESTIAYVKEHYAERVFRYSITTNGTILDDKLLGLLTENDFSVVVSMDAVGSIQDRLRPYRNGRGTSDDIEQNVRCMQDGVSPSARSTITRWNLDIAQVCAQLSQIGFKGVHFAPVSTDDAELALDADSISTLRDELLQLADRFIEDVRSRRTPAFMDFGPHLAQLEKGVTASFGCGAGRRLVAVTPEGNLYPCHRFVGMLNFEMGNIWDNLQDNATDRFWAVNTQTRSDCSVCWIRGLCGGGCLHEASREDGSISEVADPLVCEYRRMFAEVTIDLLRRLQAERLSGVTDKTSEGIPAC